MIVPVRMTAGDKTIETYAMLDGGATNPIVREEMAKRLNLKYEKRKANLVTVGEESYGVKSFTEFKVENLDGDLKLEMKKAVVMKILTTKNDKPPTNDETLGETYLEDVSFRELPGEEVNMIIPITFSWCWLGGRVRRSTIDKPIAIETLFGWTLAGGKPNEASDLIACYRTAIEMDDDELKADIKRLFRHEFPDILENKTHESPEDVYAMKQMEESIHFDEEIGHYRVGLPWKTSREEVAEKMNKVNSSKTSLARLKKQIQKIKDDKTYFKEGEYFGYVKKQMNNMFEDGYVEVLEENNIEEGIPTWVMPLNVVYQPHKPTKPRCCHDGKAKTAGVSLNDRC